MGTDSVVDSSSKPRRASLVGKAVGGAVTGALILGIGLAGGYLAARQGGAAAGGAHAGEAAGEHAGEPAGEHAGEAGGAPALSPRTLANLGVEVGELVPTDFVRTRGVAAVVEPHPDARHPVASPVAGTIRRVLVETGRVVRAGEPVAELVRDAFPRPTLSLTSSVLAPVNEDFHRSLSDLRTSAQSVTIAREELARVRTILAGSGSGGALPSKAEIDLSYDERRASKALENARLEARRHGLTDEEIATIEGGGAAVSDLPPVRRILERNRLWSPEADALLALLPEAMRASPYAIAVLGELAGSHVLSAELVAAARAHPALATAFLDVAGLLQAGETTAGLLALEDAGALGPVVTLVAPRDAPDYDVGSVVVRAGARIERGTVVVELCDERRMLLRLHPAGGDAAAVANAFAAGGPLTAEPLVPGDGIPLEGLRIERIAGSGTADGSDALIPVTNLAVGPPPAAGVAAVRTWTVRDGTRYVVAIPLERLSKRFVLPADAVTSRGADSVVLLAEGASFRAVPVRVDYADSKVAVVANDGAVFPGDRAVVKGAYALSLALQAGSGGAAAAHAGHHH